MPLVPLKLEQWRQFPAIRVWGTRNYRVFMSGLGAFYATSWMQRVGVGWLAWELSHSHAWVGAIAAADLLPLMVLGPFAGAIADRMDPVKLMRWSQLALLVQAIALVVATASGLMTVELLLALSLVSGLIHPTYTATRQMLVPLTVSRDDYPSAITMDSCMFHGSRFVGPVIAALLIAQMGVTSAFVVHVAGCLVFVVQTMRLDLVAPKRQEAGRAGILTAIKDGMDYVRRHPGIWPLFIMLAIASLVARPLQELLPGFAGAVFDAGATGLAWLTSGMGLGSLAAGLYLTMRGHVKGLAQAAIWATCGLGLSTLGFVATASIVVAVPFAIAWGFALTLMGVSIQAQTQVAIEDGMRGRVMMIYAIIYRGLPALGALVIGLMSEHVGIRTTFAVAGVLTLAAFLGIVRRRGAIDAAMLRP